MTAVCTDAAANVVPIWIWIVQWLDNSSEWCRTDDGTRFDNAVKQICCQKFSFACAYTCVRVRTCAYICICAWVCAAGCMRAHERGRICANIAGILKYPRNI